MNEGKRFEEQIKKSLEKQNIFYLRLKDAGGWNRGEQTRFTVNNLCDLVAHYNSHTMLIELKTHKGKSIPQTALKQYEKMAKIEHSEVISLFILNFRDLNETYLISAKEVKRCLKHRKSVDVGFCKENGILIEQTKLRVNYIYTLHQAFYEFIRLNNL